MSDFLRAKEKVLLVSTIFLLILPILLVPMKVHSSSAGNDAMTLNPAVVNRVPGDTTPFTQDVNISYATPAALPFQNCTAIPCYPQVLGMQYAVLYDSSVIDVDLSFCSTVSGTSYCGVTPGAYALLFPIQTLSSTTCATPPGAVCPQIIVVSGTTKRIYIASVASLSLTGGVSSPGGVHSTIHWKVTASSSAGGSSAITFSSSDTFYGTSMTSPVDPGMTTISYTPTNGEFASTPLPPIAAFRFPGSSGEYEGLSGKNVTLDGSASKDPDHPTPPLYGILSWTWSFGDSSPSLTRSVPTISHNYTLAPGQTAFQYTASLTVVDADDHLTSNVATAKVSIKSANLRPVAAFNYTITADSRSKYSPNTIFTNSTLLFDGRSSEDLDGDQLAFYWDFGDGRVDVGTTTTHTFTNARIYKVKLTVTEIGRNPSDTLSNSTTQTITVTAGVIQIPPPTGLGLFQYTLIGGGAAVLTSMAVYFVRRRGRVEEVPDEWR